MIKHIIPYTTGFVNLFFSILSGMIHISYTERSKTMKTIFLSPSDLAFLYQESTWGFYQKYTSNIKRPPVIIPKVFTTIDVLTKMTFSNKSMASFDKSFPDGLLVDADKWVKSKTITNPEFPNIEVGVRGKIDGLLKFSDSTHSVIDFKTCEISQETLSKYIMQLSCYSYALRYPNSSSDYTAIVNDKVGLFVFQPTTFDMKEDGKANLGGDFKYVEYPWSEEDFVKFISEKIIPLLSGKEPMPNEKDPCWVYLKQFGFEYEEE